MPNTKDRGLYAKYNEITRADGRSAPGERHHGCDYFVIDITHDQFAAPALLAYAEACDGEYPQLASDLRAEANAIRLRRPGNAAL